jgi:hypothetical protein
MIRDDVSNAKNFCGSLTTSTPPPQHAVLLTPQHHSSLSARPLHDVICTFPVGARVCEQMLRQAPLV